MTPNKSERYENINSSEDTIGYCLDTPECFDPFDIPPATKKEIVEDMLHEMGSFVVELVRASPFFIGSRQSYERKIERARTAGIRRRQELLGIQVDQNDDE